VKVRLRIALFCDDLSWNDYYVLMLSLHKHTKGGYFDEIWNGYHVTGRHPEVRFSFGISDHAPHRQPELLAHHFVHYLV
jgi:hypothetical protein